ncbi:MAG: alpha/beta fold hydrolase, partial [Myxococcota bacterium]
EGLVDQLVGLNADRTYYMLDHRGVGRSTRLRCPSSEGIESPNSIGLGEGEIEACLEDLRAEWTDAQLAGFSSVNAARDLGELIAHLRVEDEVVTLLGGSYGTLWLERYLVRYPEQPDSVVFTAVALDVDLLSVDRYVDDVTARWLDACDADESCGPRFQEAFGQSAREVVTDAFSGAEKTLCPEIEALEIDIPILKPFFGQLFGSLEGRSFYAPIVYRMARCQPEDVAAITQLVEALSPPPGPPDLPLTVRNWGFALAENITVSELTSDRAPEDVLADYDSAIAVQGPTPRLVESRAVWPRYDAPPFANSDYRGAALLLHGEYDFLPTEVYQRTVEHYERTNPNADFVLLPGAPHSIESPTLTGGQCGLELMISRLLDPNAPLSDCPERIRPLVFAPPAGVSTAIFGTTDPWNGVPESMDFASTFATPPQVRPVYVRDVDSPFGPRLGVPALIPRAHRR